MEREHIGVAADDTLDSVLERVRAAEAPAVVLEVDERSPLLIGLHHLDRLEDAAQAAGVAVAVASTNSALLNAARVFGLDVIDRRAPSPPPAGDTALPAAGASGSDGPDDDEAAPESAEAAPIARPVAARLPDRRERRDDTRLDPYGQPYPGAHTAGGEADPEPARPPAGRVVAARAPVVEEEGWDDDLDAELYDDAGPDWDRGRRGPLAALAASWAGARGWLARRRDGDVGRYDEGWGDSGDAEDVDDDFDARAARDAVLDADDTSPRPGTRRWAARVAPTRTARFAAAARPGAYADDAEDVAGGEDGDWAVPAAASPGLRPTASTPPLDDDAAVERPVDDFADDDWDEDGLPVTGAAPHRSAPRPRRRGALGALLIGALALLLVGALAAYWAFAAATVTLVARTGNVAAEFNVVVGEIDPNSPQGRPTAERIVVPARRIIVPLSATATRPATGARLEPDLTAGGTVVLTNPYTEPVAVPKGTTLAAPDGRAYVTQEAVTVAGADPFGAGEFGTATVKVAATVRGSAGNIGADAVRGQLPSGVYYNNRNAPIAGGTDRKIPVAARQDLAAARAAAEEVVRAQGQAAIAGAAPPGATVMRDTAGVGNFTVEFSVKEGADADGVTATVKAEGTALTYQLSDVEARSKAEIERRLAAATKMGEPIVPGSVTFEPPQLVEDQPGLLTWKVAGSARTRAAVGGDRERAELARRLARKNDDEARAILRALPGVSAYTVDYGPRWFPDRMPWRASAIEIRLADAR